MQLNQEDVTRIKAVSEAIAEGFVALAKIIPALNPHLYTSAQLAPFVATTIMSMAAKIPDDMQ